jgi:MFS family permease
MTPGAVRRGSFYYGWNIVMVSIVAQIAANGVPLNCMSLFLRPWSQELHAPISDILVAYVPMLVLTSVTAPLVGALADRRPARLLLGLGLGGVALVCLATSKVTQLWQLQAIYALALPLPLNLAASLVCNPLVSRWFVRSAGLALGLSAFGIGLAGIVLPPIVAHVMPVIGWRQVWRIAAVVIGVIMLPVVVAFARDRPTVRDGLHYVMTEDGGPCPHDAGAGARLSWMDVLRRKNFLLLIAVLIAVAAVGMGCVQNIAPIAQARGFDPQTAALMLSILNIAHLASALLMGALSDRVGVRTPLALLSAVAASAALLLGFGQGLAPLLAGAALVGFCGGLWPVLAAAVRAEFGAAAAGRSFGMLMSMLILPAMTPSLIARTQEATGSYAPALTALAVLALAGGVLILQLQERRGLGRIAAATPSRA